MEKINLPGRTWQWSFVLPHVSGEIYHVTANSRIAAEASYLEDRLTCSFLFDFKQAACLLSARADAGDRITVRYLEYRIELYVGDQLCDEEWPYGNICIGRDALLFTKTEIEITPFYPCTEPQSVVLGHFRNAEGWHPEENVWVGDCMPFAHNGRYHVYYLKDRHHHRSKWGKGAHQWAHISSADLVSWQIHPLAVPIDRQEEGSICTGSVICRNDLFYAFYSIRTMDNSPAPLCCSISRDGYHFMKSEMKILLSDIYRQSSARDPKVFADQNGLFHMLVTTSIRHGNNWQGCLAHLTSTDLTGWKEEEPALLTEVYAEDCLSPWSIEPECSDYFHNNGWFYLVTRSEYWMARQPFGPWQQPEDQRIPCGAVPKMAFWQDERIIFTGFTMNGGYAGRMTFREAVQRQDGTLEFFPLT